MPVVAPKSTEGAVASRDAQRAAAREELVRSELGTGGALTDCAAACRALVAMGYAVARLCTLLDVPSDELRCDDARERLASAHSRVQEACVVCPRSGAP
jgi:hypothetical protein